MASGDIYEIVDVQMLQGSECENVYFYEQRGAFVPVSGNTAFALGEEFNETILPVICGIQDSDLVHVETRVRNLFDATDAANVASGNTGLLTGSVDAMPSFVAAGYQLPTDNAQVRDGAKRYAGMNENMQENGVWNVLYYDELQAVADAIAAPITGGLIITDDIMFPVVVQRVRTGTPGNYEYRLPETSGEAVVGTIIEALWSAVVTSQISRKLGTGV